MNCYDDILCHHGIKGQRWGDRNGPPYPLGTSEHRRVIKRANDSDNKIDKVSNKHDFEKNKHITNGSSKVKAVADVPYKNIPSKYSMDAKKHVDSVLNEGTSLYTLSFDPFRTKNTDMFYAAYTKRDINQYGALFNRKLPKTIYDEEGNPIGSSIGYKFRIKNDITKNIKVASEDSGAKMFTKLYREDDDFRNFVNDPERMSNHFVDDKYKFKGYREARTVLNKVKNPSYSATDSDLHTLYRMFNYVIPSDGEGDVKKANDVSSQRMKFFNEAKKEGFGALLDTNDAIYGAFKAQQPVIVFDMDSIILDNIKQTTYANTVIDKAGYTVRKLIGA